MIPVKEGCETAETRFAEGFYIMFDFAEYLVLDGKKRMR
jgi:hypothetical protein